MKRNEIESLKAKSVEELRKELQEKETALRSARFDLAAGKVKNTFLVKEIRKTIARIKTFINLKKESESNKS